MIPKVVHYCWFGRGKMPRLARKCIKSWRRFLPDYEIQEWNEDNFDVNQIPYTAEAYAAGKYAFVSDYARFKILHELGGVYFDTDVEIIRPLNDILDTGPFMGLEKDPDTSGNSPDNPTSPALYVAPGLGLAATPGLDIYAKIIDAYKERHFIKSDGSYDLTTVVRITTGILLENGLEIKHGVMDLCGIKIYPKEFFCPITYRTGIMQMTSNTRTIHHFAESWHSYRERQSRKRVLAWTKQHLGNHAMRYVDYFWRPFDELVPAVWESAKKRILLVAHRAKKQNHED